MSTEFRMPGVTSGLRVVAADEPGSSMSAPPCLYPLRSEQARAEYHTLASALLERQRLTTETLRSLSEYAVQFDCLQVSLQQGATVRSSQFDQLKRARKSLRLADLDTPVAPP